uniref:DUF5753 domain-containing protein n=1 Tax=Microbispora cellulosiformans TaxID=2614688 RepID=UPI001CD93329
MGLETECTTIRKWGADPRAGLLQNEGYAHEIISAARPELTAEEVSRHVDARMARKIYLVGPRAPTLHALVDEHVLRHAVGAPGVNVASLTTSSGPRPGPTSFQVLLLTAAAHGGLEGAFSVLSFDDKDPDAASPGPILPSPGSRPVRSTPESAFYVSQRRCSTPRTEPSACSACWPCCMGRTCPRRPVRKRFSGASDGDLRAGTKAPRIFSPCAGGGSRVR